MTCPVNVSLSGGYPDGHTGAKTPPSLRRSEVYPLVFRQYYRDPYLFRSQEDRLSRFRFGREADGRPAEPWDWDDLE